MRFVPTGLAALLALAAIGAAPAIAQDNRTSIIIRKPPARSYLDAGTVVPPGSGRYLNYVDSVQSRYPNYGNDGSITGSRYPLPGPFYLPGR